MYSRCINGPLDSEDKVGVYNPYLSDLFLEWFICVLGNQNGKVKLEFELIQVNTLDSVGKNIVLKCDIGRWVSFWRMSSSLISFIPSTVGRVLCKNKVCMHACMFVSDQKNHPKKTSIVVLSSCL